MARPLKNAADKQSKRLPPIRCTEAEDRDIRFKAFQAGMSLSEYVRMSALTSKIIVKDSTIDTDLFFQIRKVAVNLNQQTRKFHETGNPPVELKELWNKLSELMDKIRPE